MANIHKQQGKPFWYCAYTTRTPDGALKRRFKSTKTANRRQAEEICRSWELAARQASNGRLAPEGTRDVIARGVSDIFTAAYDERVATLRYQRRHAIAQSRAWSIHLAAQFPDGTIRETPPTCAAVACPPTIADRYRESQRSLHSGEMCATSTGAGRTCHQCDLSNRRRSRGRSPRNRPGSTPSVDFRKSRSACPGLPIHSANPGGGRRRLDSARIAYVLAPSRANPTGHFPGKSNVVFPMAANAVLSEQSRSMAQPVQPSSQAWKGAVKNVRNWGMRAAVDGGALVWMSA